MSTAKCHTKGCRNRITPPSKYNNWNLWCNDCHAAVDPVAKMNRRQKQQHLSRQAQQRIFRDGRAGKLQHF